MNRQLEDPWIHPLLDDELYDLYMKLGSVREYSRNGYVMNCYTPVKNSFLVIEGACQYEYVNDNGLVRALGTLYPRASFCEFPNIINTVCELDIKAKVESKLVVVPYSRLAAEIHVSPELSKKHLKYMCDKKNHFLEIYHHLMESNTFCRFIAYLRSIISYTRVNTDSNGNYLLPMRDTHETLAEVIGCSRVTISRMLGYMSDNGYISFPDKDSLMFNIILLDENYMNEKFSRISWKDISKKVAEASVD